MYKCIKCNKEFPTPSKLELHNNRKNPCNLAKEDLQCNICNVKFIRPAHKREHELTKKHISRFNKTLTNNLSINNMNDEIENLNNKYKNEIEFLNEKILKLQNENLDLSVPESRPDPTSVINNNSVKSYAEGTGKIPMPAVRNTEPTFQNMILYSTRVV